MISTEAMHRRRDQFLTAWARLVTRRPRLTLALCVLIAALSAVYAALNLGFMADRSKLVDPELDWQQRYAEFQRLFPRWDDAVVVIDTGGDPFDAVVNQFIDALAESLEHDARFAEVLAGFPTEQAPVGLLLGEPLERVQSVVADLQRAGPLLGSPSLGHLLALSALGKNRMTDADREDFRVLLEAIAAAGRGERDSVLPPIPATQRFVTPSGQFAFVFAKLVDKPGEAPGVVANGRQIRALRKHIAALRAEPRFAAIEAGVTGVPVLESDETRQSMVDSTRASAIGMAAIALLAVLVYRGVSVPLMILASLLLGLCCSFAWAALSVGHLQVLSIVFMIILVGLGSDMAIHLISRLEVVHPDHDEMGPAIEDAFRSAGPGILTGTLTTAAAFAATGLTEFAGIAELGIIAAGGIVICTLVSLSAFPAMLTLLPHPGRRLRGREGGVSRPYMRGKLNWVDTRAPIVLGAWLFLLAGAGYLATKVRYDTDLLKMLPDNVESVVWERRIAADDERSAWHAIVIAHDADEARELTTKLRALPEVADVGAAGMLFPADLAAKQAALATIPAIEFQETPPIDFRDAASGIAASFDDEALRAAAEEDAALTDDQAALAERIYQADRRMLAQRAAIIRAAQPALAADLPPALRDQFVGVDGSLLLRVYPRASETGVSVLDASRLGPFVQAVYSVAPRATGPTVQIYESAKVIRAANINAALYAGAAIVLLLLLDFRRPSDVASAMSPVVAAIIALLGLMGAIGLALNFANTIVAPLLLGLGVTAGVHAVHRWRQQPADRPAGLAGGAGRAITMTLATTLIGFAAMMTAEHRGIRSLGFVMTAGLALVWAATTLLLPAVLRLRTRNV